MFFRIRFQIVIAKNIDSIIKIYQKFFWKISAIFDRFKRGRTKPIIFSNIWDGTHICQQL